MPPALMGRTAARAALEVDHLREPRACLEAEDEGVEHGCTGEAVLLGERECGWKDMGRKVRPFVEIEGVGESAVCLCGNDRRRLDAGPEHGGARAGTTTASRHMRDDDPAYRPQRRGKRNAGRVQ